MPHPPTFGASPRNAPASDSSPRLRLAVQLDRASETVVAHRMRALVFAVRAFDDDRPRRSGTILVVVCPSTHSVPARTDVVTVPGLRPWANQNDVSFLWWCHDP